LPDQHRFFKTADGLRLAVHAWFPDQQALAQMILVHGLGEHCRRYEAVARTFTRAGFNVQGLDLRGHGYSGGRRGHAPSYEALMQDLDDLVQQVRLQGPQPLFLYGHSLGGNLVINYLLRRHPGVSGAVASSPLLQLSQKPPRWKVKVVNTLAAIAPAMTINSNINPRHLSHEKDVVEKYRHDPLVHNRVSLRLVTTMLDAGQWALDHAAEIACPLLLAHGQADPICAPHASRLFAERAGPICTLKLWPDCLHELHNEVLCKQTVDYSIRWMLAKQAR